MVRVIVISMGISLFITFMAWGVIASRCTPPCV